MPHFMKTDNIIAFIQELANSLAKSDVFKSVESLKNEVNSKFDKKLNGSRSGIYREIINAYRKAKGDPQTQKNIADRFTNSQGQAWNHKD